MVRSDADRTRLNLGFTSDVDRTGLYLVSPRMLVAQDFILLIFAWTYTSDASLIRLRNSLKLQFV